MSAPPAERPAVRVKGLSGPSGVQIVAYKPTDDGKGTIVRLFGDSGKDETIELEWLVKPARVSRSDNSEQPLAPLEGPFDVPPWALMTLRID